jgi:hypothetical protein
MLHHQQTAVRVHHHGLARLFELLPVVRAALRLQPHLVKRPTAATVGWRGCSVHTAIIGFFHKHRKLARGTGVPHKQPPCPSLPSDPDPIWLRPRVSSEKNLFATELLAGAVRKTEAGMSDSSLIPALFVVIDPFSWPYGFGLAAGFAPPPATLGLSSVKESSALNGNWRTDC